MITLLRVFFSIILAAMLYITIKAGLHENMFAAIERLGNDPWAVATLWDAYCGFLTFYVWVAYKECWGGRIVWFVLIMAFGNIAMSIYALIQLFKVTRSASFLEVVERRAA